MNKTEYLRLKDEAIDAMSIESLREYTKRLDISCQKYFSAWISAENKLTKLQMETHGTKSKRKKNTKSQGLGTVPTRQRKNK